MSRHGICLALWGLLLGAAVDETWATIFVNDPFTYSDGNLAGQTPSPGPGATWNPGSATGVNPVQVTNGEAVVRQISAVNSEDIANVFGAQSATATTYARFDFRLPAADNAQVATDPDVANEGVFFISLRASGASALRARTGILAPAAAGFRLAVNADNSNLAASTGIWPSDLSFDTTYRAIVSFNATDAVGKLWLNPVNEMSASVTHTGASTSIGTLIDRIVLRQNDDYDGKQIVDNLVVASTFAEALNSPTAAVAGDYNNNSVVDAADYVVWREAQAAGATSLDNRDPAQSGNPVGDADYNYWRARFGNPSPASSAAAPSAVPEPTTVLLAALGVAVWAARSRALRIHSAAI
jgi:hypothetical protein